MRGTPVGANSGMEFVAPNLKEKATGDKFSVTVGATADAPVEVSRRGIAMADGVDPLGAADVTSYVIVALPAEKVTGDVTPAAAPASGEPFCTSVNVRFGVCSN